MGKFILIMILGTPMGNGLKIPLAPIVMESADSCQATGEEFVKEAVASGFKSSRYMCVQKHD